MENIWSNICSSKLPGTTSRRGLGISVQQCHEIRARTRQRQAMVATRTKGADAVSCSLLSPAATLLAQCLMATFLRPPEFMAMVEINCHAKRYSCIRSPTN